MRTWSYLKCALGGNPTTPGSLANLGLRAYAGCLAPVIGMSHWFGVRPQIGPVLVALGLHTVLTGVAESLPMRRGEHGGATDTRVPRRSDVLRPCDSGRRPRVANLVATHP